ncbi:orotidine 5-phosphate decarboxylase [Agrilactobacillus composti DSM 18527 = JCM 14202]|uniref:Orotidine 5'-phosphate decarboxylase n=1 Tax=Agrilactobacillus composti DSM 18527 = JCM 14202 TaxID=1423734 RepID=X0PH16_9LACO|nr:orotidine-5'-phosphate decarboxylase [Agrilactobacillus composti]KRM36513.1 orotidine 5-phosphate decarboxylase [Agrilactobacillus composti DSM 18527 = JCM 14202]GAF41369.1 orotidine 5'-phosphate decarboxylase [Agrilactobacillus composti DSM 18527 = JCM 14202]
MTRPIIALDFATSNEMFSFLDKFPKDAQLFVKIGMEMYYQSGPDVIKNISARGHDIFLDLKLHDIPNTVERAMRVIGELGNIKLTTVHAAGGSHMIAAAKNGLLATPNGQNTKLLAITQLTSTSQRQLNEEQLIPGTVQDSVLNYARVAQQNGADGVVSSGLEVQAIKAATGSDFLCVTPGIRLQTQPDEDQTRVVTPAVARQNGSDYIVVGRPITQATDAVSAYQQILESWEQK